MDLFELEEQTRFDLDRFASELSDDARTVAKLVCDPPTDIKLTAHAGYGLNSPTSIKKALIEFLGDLGWTARRIGESFREIGEALR